MLSFVDELNQKKEGEHQSSIKRVLETGRVIESVNTATGSKSSSSMISTVMAIVITSEDRFCIGKWATFSKWRTRLSSARNLLEIRYKKQLLTQTYTAAVLHL